jgi:parvulin-like peptidyl-prolyl isomerase
MGRKTSSLRIKTVVACFCLLAIFATGICHAEGEQAGPLATFKGGVITETDMDRELEKVPFEVQRRIAADEDAIDWIVPRLQVMALRPELVRRARETGLLDRSPELQARVAREQDQVLVRALRNHVREECLPTPEEIREFHERNREQFVIPARARIRYVFTSEENGGEKAAEARIKEAHALIKAGSDFQEVARLYSETGVDPERLGAPTKVVLPQINPDIAGEIRKLREGEMSEPFKSKYGYHIIEVVEEQPEHQQTLEEAKDRVQRELQNQCTRLKGEGIDREAAGKYPVEAFPEKLKDMEGDDSEVVIRCGTATVGLGEFRWVDTYEHRLEVMRNRISDLQLARYAEETGLADRPEVGIRLQETETDILAGAMTDYLLETRVERPSEKDIQEWFEKYRKDYRIPELVGGAAIKFEAAHAAGADRREEFRALQRARQRALEAGERLTKGESFEKVSADVELPDEVQVLEPAESHGALFDVHTADLEPGQVSEPLQRKDGWFLYWKGTVIPPRDPALDEARAEVEDDCLSYRKQEERKVIEKEVADEIELRIDEDAVGAYLARLVKVDDEVKEEAPSPE